MADVFKGKDGNYSSETVEPHGSYVRYGDAVGRETALLNQLKLAVQLIDILSCLGFNFGFHCGTVRVALRRVDYRFVTTNRRQNIKTKNPAFWLGFLFLKITD